jgi:hypothetical protein
METRHLWIGTWVVLLAGCASTPVGPPEEVAPRIVAALDAGKEHDAVELFEASAREKGAAERLYPLLYEEARARYQKGESEPSARVLAFMSRRYPEALAVREALVYALFLERAESEVPAPELVAAIGTAIEELRKAGASPPWIALVEAQQAIDRGEPDAARAAFAGFKQDWDGRPEELTVYVEDIERYLVPHP